jgi:outer membrane protein OmpA-like peptidoglycan-associated protein
MRRVSVFVCAMAIGPVPAALAWSQSDDRAQQGVHVDTSGKGPVFRVTVVDRSTKAVNYQHRSGPTEIAFRGTSLMPEARGEAIVNSKQGRIEIKARMERLTPATQFGPEYLTYVLWAVTPGGRPKNLGEVLLNGRNSNMAVTTDLQTFGLIVTAEPYFAVTQPSDVVVMENEVTDRTTGTIQPIEAHYELLKRGQYVASIPQQEVQPLTLDRKAPLELYEARNAVRIARWTGADRYAPDVLHKAEESLLNAEEGLGGKVGKKTVAQNSRDAAQEAEDARLLAMQKMEDERVANEKAAAAEQAEQAESARVAAEQARAEAESEAERSRAESERARISAEQAKTQATADAEQARTESESVRLAAEQARAEAEADAERVAQEKADAEADRDAARAQQQAAEAEAVRARDAAEQAEQNRLRSEQEKTQLREQLRQQLNAILQTRETARGLIVNMSDVLFDTGKYTLKPGGREKLAKIAGIILAHPGLKLEADGFTDSVGSDEFNKRLSEQRASSVREYFLTQSVPADSVTAIGFGKDRPVASNDTPTGRQLNRRVELIVSGEVIGTSAQNSPTY